MIKWILKAVSALMLSNVIKVRWDVNNAKPMIDAIQAAAADGVITNVELGLILDKVADEV